MPEHDQNDFVEVVVPRGLLLEVYAFLAARMKGACGQRSPLPPHPSCDLAAGHGGNHRYARPAKAPAASPCDATSPKRPFGHCTYEAGHAGNHHYDPPSPKAVPRRHRDLNAPPSACGVRSLHFPFSWCERPSGHTGAHAYHLTRARALAGAVLVQND